MYLECYVIKSPDSIMVMCPNTFAHIVYIIQGDLHLFIYKSVFFSILKYVFGKVNR